jgi:hypothetical protein
VRVERFAGEGKKLMVIHVNEKRAEDKKLIGIHVYWRREREFTSQHSED